jgi:hypothetical protein
VLCRHNAPPDAEPGAIRIELDVKIGMIEPFGSDMPQACSRLCRANVHARGHHVLCLEAQTGVCAKTGAARISPCRWSAHTCGKAVAVDFCSRPRHRLRSSRYLLEFKKPRFLPGVGRRRTSSLTADTIVRILAAHS